MNQTAPDRASRPAAPTALGGLFRRRACWVPTWRGGWVLLLALTTAGVLALRTAHPFLAVTAPYPGDVMIVEGWANDYALQAALVEFKRQPYRRLFVTGGPIEKGAPLVEYRNAAELTAATLLKLGLDANLVQAVPAPETSQDRTYASALALKHWLLAHGGLPAQCNIVSVGAHARRTRLLFAKALGPQVRVGIIAVPSHEYEAERWWRSSAGVRTVLSEVIAYGYARFCFQPAPE